jgi:hypothetical protein
MWSVECVRPANLQQCNGRNRRDAIPDLFGAVRVEREPVRVELGAIAGHVAVETELAARDALVDLFKLGVEHVHDSELRREELAARARLLAADARHPGGLEVRPFGAACNPIGSAVPHVATRCSPLQRSTSSTHVFLTTTQRVGPMWAII